MVIKDKYLHEMQVFAGKGRKRMFNASQTCEASLRIHIMPCFEAETANIRARKICIELLNNVNKILPC